MSSLTINPKKVTLDEQIEFVRQLRKSIESNPDLEIGWTADSEPTLLHIEENLITIKMWYKLPNIHLAAMDVMDQAYKNIEDLNKKGELMPSDITLYWTSLYIIISEHANPGLKNLRSDMDRFKRIGAIAITAITKLRDLSNG